MNSLIDSTVRIEPIYLTALLLYLLLVVSYILRYLRKTDRRARHILESIDESFFGFDNKWRFVYVNRRAELFLNKTRKDLLGQNVFSIYPNFKEAVIYKYYVKAKVTKKPVSFFYRAHNDRDYKVNVHPSKDGLSVYFNDVTRVKKTEARLIDSEHKFREMADSAPVLIWMSGVDKDRSFFNKTWLDFRGRKLEEEIGNGWLEGVHPDDVEECYETYTTSFDARIEYEMEYRLLRYDGNYHWMLSRGIPRFDKNGEFLGYVGSVVDISDRKEMEERKDEFISIASHELKTPVTSIKAFTQILIEQEKKQGDTKTVQYLKRVDNQINNLTSLINDLLDVSKIEAGKLQFEKSEISFNPFLESIVDDLQTNYMSHRIVIELNEAVVIQGNDERLRQVLINLIDNAVKYSPGQDRIVINAKSNGHSLTVSVQDFGFGIPKEKQRQIFERFYRVNGPKSETFGGLGLGLYISHEIIRRHGGRMWVESEVGQGSTFYFSIPSIRTIQHQSFRHQRIHKSVLIA